jgi:hypothetical protein
VLVINQSEVRRLLLMDECINLMIRGQPRIRLLRAGAVDMGPPAVVPDELVSGIGDTRAQGGEEIERVPD